MPKFSTLSYVTFALSVHLDMTVHSDRLPDVILMENNFLHDQTLAEFYHFYIVDTVMSGLN